MMSFEANRKITRVLHLGQGKSVDARHVSSRKALRTYLVPRGTGSVDVRGCTWMYYVLTLVMSCPILSYLVMVMLF